MTVSSSAPADHAPGSVGNDADVRYLVEARAGLRRVMPVTHAVSAGADCHALRALARDALTVQTGQLETVSACLAAWGRADVPGAHEAANGPPGLHGSSLQHAFTDHLASHAAASMTAARAEMVAGVHRLVRAIAEDALRAYSRLLAAIGDLPPPVTQD
ncbi:hypothetical protein [Nocardioides euryhalodurans]|uniref:DUF305 domain-containing protein n=1 Tax=Nocardioides euryhalodurans TaxID=2518370 RepID=A0A4P7GQU4_9ACTN|nr:hypothetical protein [Nocardioides euryhalodurans]QBR94227.1 hypothetical protein EXE57_19485 [Nocardioides euryhalodurans]